VGSSDSSSSSIRRGAIGLAASGLLLGLGGGLHPRVDTSVEFEQGLAGMFASSSWGPSHALTMAGFAALAMSLAVLARGFPGRARIVGYAAAAAAGFAALESVPHLLAASDEIAVRQGGETPLADLHTSLQAVSTPAVGLSVAVLAVVGARTHALDGGRVATVLAVVGGTAFALAGPAILVTENSELSPLFAGSAGLALWAVVAGVRRVRRLGAVQPADRDRPAR
jgi:hypothetical protein